MEENKNTNKETIEIKQLKTKPRETEVREDGSKDASLLTREAEKASMSPAPEFKVETHDLGCGRN